MACAFAVLLPVSMAPANADTVCSLELFGHRARVVFTDDELTVDEEPVFAYTETGELSIFVHRMNGETDRRHFWHEATHLAVSLMPGSRRKWREEDMAKLVELLVPYVLERNPWVKSWTGDAPNCSVKP